MFISNIIAVSKYKMDSRSIRPPRIRGRGRLSLPSPISNQSQGAQGITPLTPTQQVQQPYKLSRGTHRPPCPVIRPSFETPKPVNINSGDKSMSGVSKNLKNIKYFMA